MQRLLRRLPTLVAAARQRLATLWPQRCHVCSGHAGPHPLCDACAGELPRLPTACCPVCGLPATRGALCGRCLHRLPHFDATGVSLAYDFPVREMILAYKRGRAFHLEPWLSHVLRENWPAGAVDAIVPMPLHRRRLRERGFNQSAELARRLGRWVATPVWCRVLQRVRDTPHQVGLRLAARRRNLRGAFACRRRLDGLHIVLVDDVMTSGASLDAAARELKRAGAARVTCLVVARTLARPRRAP
ncbi:MAG: ComF family protein [Rhodocyclaceae bacterium]